jgi:tetratricopeptide (TPR) repeat protein
MRGAVLFLLLFLFAPACLGPSSRYREEKRALRQYEPVSAKPQVFGAAGRVLRARVYVDEGFQRRVHWREHVGEIVDRVNQVLSPAFGVTLEADVRPWPRATNIEELPAILSALYELDPGTDVDHVIGFTGALPFASESHHELGLATLPGKHFVMRAMNGAEELRLLEKYYPTLDHEDRRELLERRNAHKELAVFVHEWAHNHGAQHDGQPSSYLASGYSHIASHFSPENGRLIADALDRAPPPVAASSGRAVAPVDDARAIRDAEALPELRARLGALDEIALSLGDQDQDRWLVLASAYDRLGAFSRAEVAFGHAGQPASLEKLRVRRRQHGIKGIAAEREPETTQKVTAAFDALFDERYDDVRRLVAEGERVFPDLPAWPALRCGVELYEGRAQAGTKHCERALGRWEETVYAHFFLGEIQRQTRRPGPARTHLERAIALDPTLRAAYRPLAALYEAAAESDKLRALRTAHLHRFGRSLD